MRCRRWRNTGEQGWSWGTMGTGLMRLMLGRCGGRAVRWYFWSRERSEKFFLHCWHRSFPPSGDYWRLIWSYNAEVLLTTLTMFYSSFRLAAVTACRQACVNKSRKLKLKQLKYHFLVHTAAFLTVRRRVTATEKIVLYCSAVRVTAPSKCVNVYVQARPEKNTA